RDVQQGFDTGGDDERRRSSELTEVGRDVRTFSEAAVDAADPAGSEYANARRRRRREVSANRGCAEDPLRHAHGEIPRACLASRVAGLAEAFELGGREADPDESIQDADRRGNGAGNAHPSLGPERDLESLPRGKTVRDEGRLE